MKTTKPKQEYIFHFTREDGSKGRFFRNSVQDLNAQKHWFTKQYPTYKLDKVELDWTRPLLVELGKPENEEALKRLQAKCRWEHMTLTAVLMEYGDPRQWSKKA